MGRLPEGHEGARPGRSPSLRHRRPPGDAGGDGGGLPGRQAAEMPRPHRQKHVLRRPEERQAGDTRRLRLRLLCKHRGRGQSPPLRLRRQMGQDLSVVQEIPRHARAFLILPIPIGDAEVHLHDEHHRVLQPGAEEEAQGAHRPPLPEERQLRDNGGGGALQPLQAQQNDIGILRSDAGGVENAWNGEMMQCYDN